MSSTTSLGAESDKRLTVVLAPFLSALDSVPAIVPVISSAAAAAILLETRLPSPACSPPHDIASGTSAGGDAHYRRPLTTPRLQHLAHKGSLCEPRAESVVLKSGHLSRSRDSQIRRNPVTEKWHHLFIAG